MTTRRDVIFGSLCLASAGGAEALKPHRRVSLLGGRTLSEILPRSFGQWTSKDVSDLLDQKTDDNLMDRLYNQTVERVYSSPDTASQVMVLIAYGTTQSNDLQLHRPEVCYPAFGYQITANTAEDLHFSHNVTVPCRGLLATAPSTAETVLYWSRLGEYFPENGGVQRADRLRTSMAGIIADGLLARFSVSSQDFAASIQSLSAFASSLVAAVQPSQRPVLIGTARAAALSTS